MNTTAVVVEWEGTGPGVAPADTVNLFTCEINDNPPRSCESAAVLIKAHKCGWVTRVMIAKNVVLIHNHRKHWCY